MELLDNGLTVENFRKINQQKILFKNKKALKRFRIKLIISSIFLR